MPLSDDELAAMRARAAADFQGTIEVPGSSTTFYFAHRQYAADVPRLLDEIAELRAAHMTATSALFWEQKQRAQAEAENQELRATIARVEALCDATTHRCNDTVEAEGSESLLVFAMRAYRDEFYTALHPNAALFPATQKERQ